MEVLLICLVSLSNILCFLIGAKTGQKVIKGESVEIPTVNPVSAIRTHLAKREAEMEQSKQEAILRNIENYNGTPYGQEDVPGR